jgi:RecA/RadA recombinase
VGKKGNILFSHEPYIFLKFSFLFKALYSHKAKMVVVPVVLQPTHLTVMMSNNMLCVSHDCSAPFKQVETPLLFYRLGMISRREQMEQMKYTVFTN